MNLTLWHTRRAVTKVGNLVNNQALIRTPMNVRKHYKAGMVRPSLIVNGLKINVEFRNTNKIANIWEKGFKAYHYGRRVLNNPLLTRIKQGKKGKYIRLLVGGKGQKVWRVLSEEGLRKNPRSWMMPRRSPTEAYKRAYKATRKSVSKIFRESVRKDILNSINKR